MRRIAIIGNAGGGKSTLARRIGEALGLPVHEIDLLQWKPGWVRAALEEFNQVHDQWLAAPAWIIDGWGSWDAITARFDLADTIILVDHPLILHYWWAAKRQIVCLFQTNPDWPPPGCPALPITWRLFKLMWQIHWTMREQLLELVACYRDRKQIVHIRSPREMRRFLRSCSDELP